LWVDEEKDDFESKYQERKNKENNEEAITKVWLKIDKLPESIRQEVKEQFEDLSEGKNLTYERATKLFDIAVTYAKKDIVKAEKTEEAKKLLWSSASTKSKGGEDWKQRVVRNGKQVLI
jgi:hypothetical protein